MGGEIETTYWYKVFVWQPTGEYAESWLELGGVSGWADTLEEAMLSALNDVAALDPLEYSEGEPDLAKAIIAALKEGSLVPEIDREEEDWLQWSDCVYALDPDRQLLVEVSEWGLTIELPAGWGEGR